MASAVLFMFALILLIYLVWKCYWRIQLMYNSDIAGMYTPKLFKIVNENTHKYYTNLGFSRMSKKSIVICVLLRDVSNKIKEIREKAEKLGKRFEDYRVLIVENDSKDGTRKKLLKWRNDNDKVIILGCGINSEKECRIPTAEKKTVGHNVDRERINKMVVLRNIYLDFVKKNMMDYDYCAVWDMDVVGTVYIDGVANSLGYLSDRENIDAMCSYGIYRWGPLKIYYDTYAHIDEGDNFHINLKTIHDIKKGLGVQYERGTPPVKVISCFGGFTIYKIKSLENKKYTFPSENNLECEHVTLNKQLLNVYMNPSMINLILLND